jgi:hypothetical protein
MKQDIMDTIVKDLNSYEQTIPHKYPAKVKKLKKALEKFFTEHKISVGEWFFYAPNVWRERGEVYCRDADMILCIDGNLLDILNFSWSPDFENSFLEICLKNGYYYEFGCSWYLGFYPE